MKGVSHQTFRKRLFSRLLIMYHIVILPIIILGLYLYIWSYNNASDELSRHTENQLNMYLEGLNREIAWMESQQYNLLQDNELQSVAITWDVMSNVDRKESMHYLVNRLRAIQGTSAYIENISIHIRSIGKTISSIYSVQDFEDAYYASIYSGFTNPSYFINILNESLTLTVGNMSQDIDGVPFYLVEIELDKSKLQQSLDSINLYENNGLFLIGSNQELLWKSSDASTDILFEYLDQVPFEEDTQVLKINDDHYQFNQASLNERNLTVISYIPEDVVKRPLGIFKHWVWIFGVFVVIAIVGYAYYTYRLVHQPLLTLVNAFRKVEKGNLDQQIEQDSSGEFGYIYDRFNKMITRLQNLIDRNYKQTLMVQKAELKQLQSQINPHFLYNSFFILNSLAQTEDIERIEQFTLMLGEYFKFITRNEENTVDLKSEVKHARMYTEIQNMRFSRRIKVDFGELPQELEKIKVPKLIIQPIIENAYKYSLENKAEAGLLRVSFLKMNSEVHIIVEDNGGLINELEIDSLNERLRDTETKQELTGLVNIHRRIVLTYGEGSGIYLSKSELDGLKVDVRLVIKED
ncbi:sensor histidine kinase [Amphibacillus indicireducens]|uniref:HAMP domain-containing protein n=1 Tax=Amphibacillus indicireducens TaxID=1076330 RepID=A0ABP7VBT8_9BACI